MSSTPPRRIADTGISTLSEPTRVERRLTTFIRKAVDAPGANGIVVGLEADRSVTETAARLDLELAVVARYADMIDRVGRERASPNALGDRWTLTGGEGR